MVESRIDDTITDGLRDHLFRFFNTFKLELLLNVLNGNARVRDVDLLEAKLDNGVLEAMD
jgi:hypothetical protein